MFSGQVAISLVVTIFWALIFFLVWAIACVKFLLRQTQGLDSPGGGGGGKLTYETDGDAGRLA